MVEILFAVSGLIASAGFTALAVAGAALIFKRGGFGKVEERKLTYLSPDGEPCTYDEALSRWADTFSGTVRANGWTDAVTIRRSH